MYPTIAFDTTKTVDAFPAFEINLNPKVNMYEAIVNGSPTHNKD